ncbi:MAG: phosphoribosyltransferase [Desulfobacterales bacterium]
MVREKIISLPELENRVHVFNDRDQAGRIIADMIKPDMDESLILLAIPAGGVPVALAISSELGLEFDIAAVSKITLPWNSEAGYGAVAFDGTIRLNKPLMARLNLTERQVNEGIENTREKVSRRNIVLRGDTRFPLLSGKTAVLVDDGLASGFTMLCAIDAVTNSGADKVMAAVPTAHLQAAETVAQKVDRLYCANIRSGMSFAVAEAYENWYDISEKELLTMLGRH